MRRLCQDLDCFGEATHEKKHKIAVIAGDGIGKEVVPEGLRVLDAVSNDSGLRFN